MNRIGAAFPWRLLAALSALCGLLVLVVLSGRGSPSFVTVYAASAMMIGGGVAYFRLSLEPNRWNRVVHGPEARRFLAISIACLFLMALAVIILGLRFLNAIPR